MTPTFLGAVLENLYWYAVPTKEGGPNKGKRLSPLLERLNSRENNIFNRKDLAP